MWHEVSRFFAKLVRKPPVNGEQPTPQAWLAKLREESPVPIAAQEEGSTEPGKVSSSVNLIGSGVEAPISDVEVSKVTRPDKENRRIPGVTSPGTSKPRRRHFYDRVIKELASGRTPQEVLSALREYATDSGVTVTGDLAQSIASGLRRLRDKPDEPVRATLPIDEPPGPSDQLDNALLIVESLKEAAKPSHLTAIATIIREAGSDLSASEIHTMLNNDPDLFRRVGRGTYGLASWGLPSAKDSVDLARQILESELRWLTFQEIWVQMRSKGWPYREASVRIALGRENKRGKRRIRRIDSAGGYQYGLARWHAPEGKRE
jgi:hypothetical protein